MNKTDDPFARLCDFAAALPEPWKDLPSHRVFEAWRCLFDMTQQEVARRTGMVQTQISRVEGGFDARLSTWRRAYGALGFDLFLLPVPREPLKALEEKAVSSRRGTRQRAKPRRRWKEYYAQRRAEKAAARATRSGGDRMSA